MKFSCEQETLSRYLQIVARAIASKSTLPILSGIKLETKDKYLKCTATDLEIAIEVEIPNIQTIEAGHVVVPGKTFVDIIRHLPQNRINIELDSTSKMLTIASQHSTYQLPLLPAEEFPNLPDLKDGFKFEVSGEILKEAIRQTIYATLAEDPRPFLSSILWEMSPGQLRLVATDVNRLAIKKITIKNENQGTALVPVRALREIANIFGNISDNELTVILTEKLIFINGIGITFSSRLVEAQFPRYEQVIPKEFSGSLIVEKDKLISALERTALVSTSIKMSISAKGLVITAKEPDKGRSYEELEVELTGNDLEIGFNVRFMLDFLKTLDSDKLIFKYIQDQKPALMQGINKEDYLYVVMPLKLSV